MHRNFYRCVLASEVYALVPTEGHGIEEDKLRFVMWRGADGHDAIPYFASRATLRSAFMTARGVRSDGSREYAANVKRWDALLACRCGAI